jgi:hypothetical protein
MASLYDISRAARWDILIQQGSTFEQVLNFGDVPITGFSFRGQLRSRHDDSVALAEYAFTALDDYRIKVSLTPVQTDALPSGKIVHDIEVFTESDAFVQRILEGRATVTPQVTR